MQPGKPRVSLTPLRRLAVNTPELDNWLSKALKKLDADSTAHAALKELKSKLAVLNDSVNARRQVAVAYIRWLEKLELTPRAGRALALYQDLSDAFVTGRRISLRLPLSEKSARHPERVAQQLMLNCL